MEMDGGGWESYSVPGCGNAVEPYGFATVVLSEKVVVMVLNLTVLPAWCRVGGLW
jgi:hypothetical protein